MGDTRGTSLSGVGIEPDFYRTIYEQSLDGVLFTTPDGRILAANPAACEILRASEGEICRRGRHAFADVHDERWQQALRQRDATGELRATLPMCRGDGSLFIAELSSRTFTSAEGVPRACVIFRDVSDRVAAEFTQRKMVEELEERAVADELTGIRNRRGFLVAGDELLAIADRLRKTVVAVFIDVNGLKRINDEHDHAAGDLALTRVADAMREVARSSDVLGRLGGDEFAMLLFGTNATGARATVERLQQALAKHGDDAPSVTVGIVERRWGRGSDLAEVVLEADRRMYSSRRATK